MKLSIKGISNLSKFLESVVNDSQSVSVFLDSFQSQQPVEERSYLVEVADIDAGERFEKVVEDY